MRQIVIPRHGGPEVLEARETPEPTPGDGEVRIRVRAIGVNFADLILSELRAGRLTPIVARTFPLDKAADVHRFIQSRANIGKVVLTT